MNFFCLTLFSCEKTSDLFFINHDSTTNITSNKNYIKISLKFFKEKGNWKYKIMKIDKASCDSWLEFFFISSLTSLSILCLRMFDRHLYDSSNMVEPCNWKLVLLSDGSCINQHMNHGRSKSIITQGVPSGVMISGCCYRGRSNLSSHAICKLDWLLVHLQVLRTIRTRTCIDIQECIFLDWMMEYKPSTTL